MNFWGVHLEHETRNFVHHPTKGFGTIASTTLIFNQKYAIDEQSCLSYALYYVYARDDIKVKDGDDTTFKVNDGAAKLQYRYSF